MSAFNLLLQMLLKLVISAIGLALAAWCVDGISVDSPATLFAAAVLLALANIIVRPVLILLTLPVTVLSLGLFLFVINAAMMMLVAMLLPGFSINSFWSALFAWLIVAVVNAIGAALMGRSQFRVRIERLPRDDD